MKRINYVCTIWTGHRRSDMVEAGAWYLQQQIAFLTKYQHHLSQITFVLNEHANLLREDVQHLVRTTRRIQDTPVVWFPRQNTGLSYGALSDVYRADRHAAGFDYYLFIEDDYVCVQHHFDDILLGLFNDTNTASLPADPPVGYLCQLLAGYIPHAAISNGLIVTDALAAIAATHDGELPYAKYGDPYDSSLGQVAFSKAFWYAGFAIRDFASAYKAPFYENGLRHRIIDYASQCEDYLIVPIQFVEKSPLASMQSAPEVSSRDAPPFMP